MAYEWLNSPTTTTSNTNGYKTVNGKLVWDPFNSINQKKEDEKIDRAYEKSYMKNQLESFELQKADYERNIKKENKAQANLDNSAKFVFGSK